MACPDGMPFTFAVPAGSFVASNQVLANRMASSFACREAAIHKLCMSLVSPFVCLDSESSLTFVATGRALTGSNTWELVSGALPPGFVFTSSTTGPVLSITGTATALGDYTFAIRVTAPNGDFSQRTFTVTVVGITTADPLPDAQLGADYSETLMQSGLSDVTWVILDGQLPEGLELDPDTGEISGQATETGDFVFTVAVSDGTTLCSKEFHLTVGGCFIDAAPNTDLTVFQQTLSLNGGLAIWLNGSTVESWYYLDHVFQTSPFVGQSIPYVCAAGRYIGIQDLATNDNFWIDLQGGIIRNLAHNTEAPQYMNDNGDMSLQSGLGSYIYNAGANTFSANLFTLNSFVIRQINNSRASNGMIVVTGDNHLFLRSAAGVYTDLHPGGGPSTSSTAGGSTGQYQRSINSSGHVCGAWFGGGQVRAFANFGGASVFLSGLMATNNVVIINDSDQVAWDDSSTGHVFIYSGVALDIGNLGLLKGFNNSGIGVGNNFAQTSCWIYANGVVSTLISKIPSAAADGWTSLLTVNDISDDNFVTGFGIKNGVVTVYAAKVCV